jgi:hypothetical protein
MVYYLVNKVTNVYGISDYFGSCIVGFNAVQPGTALTT